MPRRVTHLAKVLSPAVALSVFAPGHALASDAELMVECAALDATEKAELEADVREELTAKNLENGSLELTCSPRRYRAEWISDTDPDSSISEIEARDSGLNAVETLYLLGRNLILEVSLQEKKEKKEPPTSKALWMAEAGMAFHHWGTQSPGAFGPSLSFGFQDGDLDGGRTGLGVRASLTLTFPTENLPDLRVTDWNPGITGRLAAASWLALEATFLASISTAVLDVEDPDEKSSNTSVGVDGVLELMWPFDWGGPYFRGGVRILSSTRHIVLDNELQLTIPALQPHLDAGLRLSF